jgi:hypothetical protein
MLIRATRGRWLGQTATGEHRRAPSPAARGRSAGSPGRPTPTELFDHQRPAVRDHFEQWLADVEKLWPEDVADAIEYIVTRPRRVAVNDIMVRPTDMH